MQCIDIHTLFTVLFENWKHKSRRQIEDLCDLAIKDYYCTISFTPATIRIKNVQRRDSFRNELSPLRLPFQIKSDINRSSILCGANILNIFGISKKKMKMEKSHIKLLSNSLDKNSIALG